MPGTLVIGLGNPHRGDDGVGCEIVMALGECKGARGRVSAGGDPGLTCKCALQLAPEWLDEAASFDRLVFVDAHVHPDWDDLVCCRVQAEYATAAFTHHMTPSMFLALLETLYGRGPEGWIVSIRGHDFDFHEGLSAATARYVPLAVEEILRLADLPAEPTLQTGLGGCLPKNAV